jgi:anti-sigma B factor antagonist
MCPTGLTHDPGRNITVDLSSLELIDSSGLGALISLYKRAHANGGTVSFVGLVDQPLVIFKLLKLDCAFALT